MFLFRLSRNEDLRRQLYILLFLHSIISAAALPSNMRRASAQLPSQSKTVKTSMSTSNIGNGIQLPSNRSVSLTVDTLEGRETPSSRIFKRSQSTKKREGIFR